jgi:hypothetical protein
MRRAFGSVSGCVVSVVVVAMLTPAPCATGQTVKVRHREASSRGFVVLKSEKGATLASGEFSEVSRGDSIKSRLVFYFRDGSVDDETSIYSQRSDFRLISDRHVQRGPSFPDPCEVTIDAQSQQVSIRAFSQGNAEVKTEHIEMPPDLANGLLFNLIANLRKDAPRLEVSYLSTSRKPRMVKLAITLEKEEPFTVAGRRLKALKWDVKPELGGLTGIVAPMIGKQPPDLHVWIAEGGVPAIVRVDAALYTGGPIWSIQLASPAW